MSILTKLRGALGTATTWAMTWGLGGLAFGSALAFLDPSIPNHWWWGIAKAVGVSSAVAGFSSGVFFSGFLGTVHRNKQIGDL